MITMAGLVRVHAAYSELLALTDAMDDDSVDRCRCSAEATRRDHC
jgi:hypothetical protein